MNQSEILYHIVLKMVVHDGNANFLQAGPTICPILINNIVHALTF